MEKIEKLPESKCRICGAVHAWSNLVLNIEYKCQKCGHVNVYNRNPEKSYISSEEAKNYYAEKRKEEMEKVERAKAFSHGGIIPKSNHAADALTYLMEFSNPFIPKRTPLFDFLNARKTQEEHHSKTNYTFKTTCEQSVDLFRIAKDLDEQNYCFHVITENTTDPNVNALLVHRSIFQKALVLDIPIPTVCLLEDFDNFGFFFLDNDEPRSEAPKKVDYSKLKVIMSWIKSVRNAKYSDTFPTKINGKPITIKVTNRSVGF